VRRETDADWLTIARDSRCAEPSKTRPPSFVPVTFGVQLLTRQQNGYSTRESVVCLSSIPQNSLIAVQPGFQRKFHKTLHVSNHLHKTSGVRRSAILTEVFSWSSSVPQANAWIVPKEFGHDRFLPHPSQFIIHLAYIPFQATNSELLKMRRLVNLNKHKRGDVL
jgi:hypothetical protein